MNGEREKLTEPRYLNKLMWALESNDPHALELKRELIGALTPENKKKLKAILQK